MLVDAIRIRCLILVGEVYRVHLLNGALECVWLLHLILWSIRFFVISLLSFAFLSLSPKILYGCPRELSLLTCNLFIIYESRITHRISLRVNLFTENLVLICTIGSLSVDGTRCQSAENRFYDWQLLSPWKLLRHRCEEGTLIMRLMAEREGAGDLSREQHNVFLCIQGSADTLIVHQNTL